MISFFLSLTCAIGFYHLFHKLNKPASCWRSIALLAAVILSRPLHLLWQFYFMFHEVESPTFIDVTVIHIALYLLVWVLLGNNRLKGFISASFTFSIINITHIPVAYIAGHLRRLFRLVFKQTLGEYIRIKKLSASQTDIRSF